MHPGISLKHLCQVGTEFPILQSLTCPDTDVMLAIGVKKNWAGRIQRRKKRMAEKGYIETRRCLLEQSFSSDSSWCTRGSPRSSCRHMQGSKIQVLFMVFLNLIFDTVMPFLPSLSSLQTFPICPCPLSSTFMASFFHNCYRMLICIYIHIPTYSLFSLNSVLCMCVFRTDHLALDSQLS